jgi:hypothetical protein
MIPDSNIVPCAGATVYVSGCQVWKGKTGILMAKAKKKAAKKKVAKKKLALKKKSAPKKSSPKVVTQKIKICPEGQYLNPVTNRCNKIKVPSTSTSTRKREKKDPNSTSTRKKKENSMLNDDGTEKLIDY